MLTYATGRGHALICRALYLPEAPDAHRVRDQGHPALRLGDAGGDQRRHPRRARRRAQRAAGPAAPLHRQAVLLPLLNTGAGPAARLIAVAVARWRIEEDHQLAKQVTGLDAGQVIRWKSWHRWTALCLLAYTYLAVAVAVQRQQEAGAGLDAGLVPITVPELLRLLRDTVIPPPRRDRPHRLHWSTCRRRHQHRARQAHQRWNAYAGTTP